MLTLEARTLLVIGGVLCWILAVAVTIQAVRPGVRRAPIDAWSLGLLIQGLGLLLVSQRGTIADAWSIALAHLLLLAGLLFYYVALQRIRGAVTSRAMLTAMPAGVAITLTLVGFTDEAFPIRVLVIMSAWLFGFSLNWWSAWQIARAGYAAGASMILLSTGLLVLTAAAFALAVATGTTGGIFTGTEAEVAFYAMNDVCVALSTLGYMAIVRIARAQALA